MRINSIVICLLILILGLCTCKKRTEVNHETTLNAITVEKESADSMPDTDGETDMLSNGKWIKTIDNDFNVSIVDVFENSKNEMVLRMVADTMQTDDKTVKFQGVRTKDVFDLTEGKTIALDIDWNDQDNGSYLTAGFFLCPVDTMVNPMTEIDYLSFEYVGVPPGKNARFQIGHKVHGNLRLIFTEGWPDKQKVGRKIGKPRIRLVINAKSLKVFEDDQLLYSNDALSLNFTEAYLFIQMSSHSNYPERTVYFDNIVVE